jgi:DNA-binding GntR family transcriptional regulator
MSPDRMGKSIIEHHNILNALRERDNNKVELLIREHRLNASKQLEEIIRKQNI